MQGMHARLGRALRKIHSCFLYPLASPSQIAWRASGDDVDPGRKPPARARQQMIEGEIVAASAILAGETVAQEHVEARERRMGRGLHEGLERDHARELHLEARGMHRPLVI